MTDGREVVFGTLNGCPVRCSRRLASRLGVQLPESEPPKTPEDETSASEPQPADVRAWAAEHDIDCPARGRIPASVMEAFKNAHE